MCSGVQHLTPTSSRKLARILLRCHHLTIRTLPSCLTANARHDTQLPPLRVLSTIVKVHNPHSMMPLVSTTPLVTCTLGHSAQLRASSTAQVPRHPLPTRLYPAQCSTFSPLAARRALSSVFCSSMAMVMGPTPPGTGVMRLALAAALSNSTSPTSR